MENFFRVVQKFHALEKIPRRFGMSEKFSMQEIHTIAAVGHSPKLNITELAEKMGVTKGTISPVVKKLARKGFISKSRGKDNKEIVLQLTVKGELAYHGHEMFHLKLHAELFGDFEQESPECWIFLEKILRVGDSLLDRYLGQEKLVD